MSPLSRARQNELYRELVVAYNAEMPSWAGPNGFREWVSGWQRKLKMTAKDVTRAGASTAEVDYQRRIFNRHMAKWGPSI